MLDRSAPAAPKAIDIRDARPRSGGWRVAWSTDIRLALRDLRAGLRGFGIFLGCLVLGVAAISGVASLSRALETGLAREGRAILGGDVAFSLLHREATARELAVLGSRGDVTVVATLRAMARTPDGRSALVEAKAVDGRYPAIGALRTDPAGAPAALLAREGDAFGAVADPVLFARLGLKPGDRILIGNVPLVLRASLLSEPDKLSGGLGFGPRLILSIEALRASGLIQPGSLVRWSYRVTTPVPIGDAALETLIADVKAQLPDSGFNARSRTNSSPRFERNLGRFTQFLALVGLVALLVGGVGIANSVHGFVERRRETLAVLKSIGATGARAFRILFIEVLALAVIGIAAGLALGAAMPSLAAALLAPVLPVPIDPGPYPKALALGALYGLLVSVAFAIWPLGRAHDVPVSALFRDDVAPQSSRPRRRYLVLTLAAALLLIAVAIGFAWDRRIAAITVAACTGAFVMLRLLGLALVRLARRLPRPRGTAARLALANIHRPGSPTPSIVLSLGLGVTLLVALAVIDGSLRRQLTQSLPERAPSFFFVDIPRAESERFIAFLNGLAPGGTIENVPMMRGRLVALNGVPAEKVSASQEAAWVLQGDRGITHAAEVPEGSSVVAGTWWAKDHSGERLVSFDAELAKGLGLTVGDSVTVNVLGREIQARIANLRTVEWRSMGINFVMVFSPNTFAGAPYTRLATLSLPNGADLAREIEMSRAIAQEFPMVTSVRVKEALEAVNDIVSQLAAAIRGASAVALLSSVMVLAGALAAGHRTRIYESVVLKALGARRATLVKAFLFEYGSLGAMTSLLGVVLGIAIGWLVVTRVMNLSAWIDVVAVGGVAGLALFVTIGLGLVGNWRILGQKAAPYLRNF
jgi:putative ABC transport system permease protein